MSSSAASQFRISPRWRLAVLAAGALLISALATAWAPARAMASCDVVAAPQGSDLAAGTTLSPFRTAGKLVATLRRGQTGCLRSGTYSEDVTVSARGSSAKPIVITSYPGERATLVGRLFVTRKANRVTFSSLDLDGRNAAEQLPSPTVTGSYVTFTDNDITNHHTGICFSVGSLTYGRAYRTSITGNDIHDCGSLPATNQEHGIYVAASRRARIAGNRIHDNADRGIQLFPDADYTQITNNLIDSNGEGILFAGENGHTSSHNLVQGNVITNSKLRYNVESWWSPEDRVGGDNLVEGNAIFGGARGDDNGGIGPQIGFVARNNDTDPSDGVSVTAP